MIEHDDPDYSELAVNTYLISNCCGAIPLGEVEEDCYGHLNGVCSKCKEHASFQKDTSDEQPRFPY